MAADGTEDRFQVIGATHGAADVVGTSGGIGATGAGESTHFPLGGASEPPAPEPHLYWRITDLVLIGPGDYFEQSEFQLYSGGANVNSTATAITALVGTANVPSLTDGSVDSNSAWTPAQVPGLWIRWQFPAPIVIDAYRMAGHDTPTRYLSAFTLQSSDDGVEWTTEAIKTGHTYPGNRTYSAVLPVA